MRAEQPAGGSSRVDKSLARLEGPTDRIRFATSPFCTQQAVAGRQVRQAGQAGRQVRAGGATDSTQSCSRTLMDFFIIN